MRFLFVDKIIDSIPAKQIKGIKHIREDEYYLYEYAEGERYFPPSLIGEALGQLAAWNVMQVNGFSARPVAGIVSSASLHREVKAGETLKLESYIDSLDESSVLYHSEAKVGEELVFSVEGALGPLLPMQNFIEEAEVRLQFEGIVGLLPQRSMDSCLRRNDRADFLNSLVFDKIIESKPGESLVAEKEISKDYAFFPDHFPKKPVLPMTVLLEAKLHLAKLFLQEAKFSSQYQIKFLKKIKMSEFVNPGDILRCYVQLHKQDAEFLVLRYRSEVSGRRVCVVDVYLQKRLNA